MNLNATLKKRLATAVGALLVTGAHAAPALKLGLTTWIGWPNHDLAFRRTLRRLPGFHE